MTGGRESEGPDPGRLAWLIVGALAIAAGVAILLASWGWVLLHEVTG